jgi:hypothetical protein
LDCGSVASYGTLATEDPCGLTRRLQLAGGKPKEEIHLCGGGLGPAAEAQCVRQQLMKLCAIGTTAFTLALLPGLLSAQGFPDDSAAAHKYLNALSLRTRLGTDSVAGKDTVSLLFQVQNRGPQTLILCMGRGHGADVIVDSDTLRPLILVDHESCVRTDTLHAGRSVTWRNTLVLPELPAAGIATLVPWVDVLDPSDCGPFGCARAVIPATPVKVILKRR